MVIDLFQIEKSPYEFAYTLSPETIELDGDEAKLKSPVEVRGTLEKHIAQTDLKGEIAAVAEIECARCLQPTDVKLKIPFNVGYVTPENYTEEKEYEINADDLEIAVFDGDKIDLNELVREQILLQLSEQHFCREDCKGLCQKCSANRNLINCNCEEKEIDPRWSALKNLK